MATKPTTNPTGKTRAPRTPRVLTPMEIEAKQMMVDAKALAKILPLVEKLSGAAQVKLVEHLTAKPATALVES